jgi:biopolymer transport protein ExbD
MSFGDSAQQEMMSEINVTPLVDVMLVLLVVFIIAAPLLTPQSLKVTLPKTTAVASDNKALHVHLTVDAQGRIELDRLALDDAQLGEILRQRAADPQFQVQLEADKAVAYGRVAELMAIAQRAGVNKLTFMTIAGR